MASLDENIRVVVDLLRHAKYAVSLTGAGISTPSGIPDFRSPQSGLWENANPFEVATIFAFKTHPQGFYDWIRPLTATIMNAQPNAAHTALAQMERLGYLKTIITQNIDMLHTRAGSRNVVEVHGHFREVTCISCYHVYESTPFIRHFVETGEIPHCPQCGGVLKPNVILFGEQLPVRELHAARQATARCDVMLVVGSSLEVAPACDLPVSARQHGAAVAIINLEETPADSVAQVIIRNNVATVLPKIAEALETG